MNKNTTTTWLPSRRGGSKRTKDKCDARRNGLPPDNPHKVLALEHCGGLPVMALPSVDTPTGGVDAPLRNESDGKRRAPAPQGNSVVLER